MRDTHLAYIIAVLREAERATPSSVLFAKLHALAGALERQAEVTWEERRRNAIRAYDGANGYRPLDAALRAAFPELAPTNDD